MLAACHSGGGGSSNEPVIIHFGLAAADLNRDGLTDIVSGSATLDGAPPHAGRLTVYLQQADNPGQYRQSAVLDTSWDPGEIEIADFDADGVLDVAVHKENLADSTGQIALFFQNGAADGTFAAMKEITTDLVSDFDAADVNGDGLNDLVTAGPRTQILLNTPGSPGTLISAEVIELGASAVSIGDLNGDGRADLAIGVGSNGTVHLYRQRDTGFEAVGELVAGAQLNRVQIADLNADTQPDVLAAAYLNEQTTAGILWVYLLPGESVGIAPSPPETMTWPAPVSPRGLAVADVNADGLPDVVTAHNLSTVFDNVVTLRSAVAVFLQQPGGELAAAVTYELDGQASDVEVADFNADGFPDILTDAAGPHVLFNDPADPGTFLTPVPIDD
jgi:hypothetical protein